MTPRQQEIAKNLQLFEMERYERMKNPWHRLRIRIYQLKKRLLNG